MLSFSQRKGLKPIRTIIQIDSADIPLRNQLWNCIVITYFKYVNLSIQDDSNVNKLLKVFWVEFYELPIDEIDRNSETMIYKIKQDFLGGHWATMYDILEFFPNHYSYPIINDNFIHAANVVLEKYLSAYRFVGSMIVNISSEQELQSIEDALNDTSNLKPVNAHLKRALEMFADRENPDYRNSIKESISAVEALASIITGKPKATLGQALVEIEKNHGLHSALKSSFSSLYGWTSDASGIRHKIVDEASLQQEDAKFMLIACSAFVNYLLAKSSYS